MPVNHTVRIHMVILREAFYIHSTLIQTELRESKRYLHVLVSVQRNGVVTKYSLRFSHLLMARDIKQQVFSRLWRVDLGPFVSLDIESRSRILMRGEEHHGYKINIKH